MDFEKLDMRIGEIVAVDEFPEARTPAFRLKVDFGEELGVKKSCAQCTHYPKAELLGKQVICVVNFPPKQIGPAISEVLILGVPGGDRGLALLTPDFRVPLGGKMY